MAKHRQPKQRKKKIKPLFQGLDFSPVETIVQFTYLHHYFYFLVNGYNCTLVDICSSHKKQARHIINNLEINNTLDLLSYSTQNHITLRDLHKTYTEFFIDNL